MPTLHTNTSPRLCVVGMLSIVSRIILSQTLELLSLKVYINVHSFDGEWSNKNYKISKKQMTPLSPQQDYNGKLTKDIAQAFYRLHMWSHDHEVVTLLLILSKKTSEQEYPTSYSRNKTTLTIHKVWQVVELFHYSILRPLENRFEWWQLLLDRMSLE